MSRVKILACAAACLAVASAAHAASYSSSYSSRSYSSGSSFSSRSYSSSTVGRSYSAPSYSASKVSPAPAPSAFKPAPAYNVRSTTVTSTYTPAPKVGAASTSYRAFTPTPSSRYVHTSTVIHSPVVVHHYGYPGGYYSNGYDAFWHGYFIASMFHQPGYGPVYAGGAQGQVTYSNGLSPMWWVLGLFLVAFVVWMLWMARREERGL